MSGVLVLGGNMLEWKPRLVMLIVVVVSLAAVLSALKTGGGTSTINYGW